MCDKWKDQSEAWATFPFGTWSERPMIGERIVTGIPENGYTSLPWGLGLRGRFGMKQIGGSDRPASWANQGTKSQGSLV